MTAVAILHKKEILKRVAAGDKITDIGKSLWRYSAGNKQATINRS